MGIKDKLKFRFSCAVVCSQGYTMYRPHITCLSCRLRRIGRGSLKANKFDYNGTSNTFVPKKGTVYILTINHDRSCDTLKNAIVKTLLELAELFSA